MALNQTIKDIITSLIAVAIILMIGIAITGAWPFMVAVKSKSMDPHIKIGDVVILLGKGRTHIITYVEGKEKGYRSFGEYGDVIVYRPNGRKDVVPVIHRALYWINKGDPMPDGRPAPNSGYITKGDANTQPDQPLISRPVKPEWIIGVAKFRIPYIGYVRLIFSHL